MSIATSNYSLLILGIVTIIGGLFVLLKNSKNRLHLSFFTFALGGGVWISGIGAISLTHDFFFDKVINFGGLVFVTGFFFLAKNIPVPMRFRIPHTFLFLPIIIDALFLIPQSLINNGMSIDSKGIITPIAGPFIIPHSLLTLLYTLLGIIILAFKLKNSHGEEKLRIKYLFLGTGIFMSTSVLFDAILPAFGITDLNLIGPLSAPIFIAIIAYAVAKHELLDIKIAIQRGLIYSILFALIIGCYLGFINIISFFVARTSDFAIFLSGAVITALGIFSVPFIESYFKKITDRYFFKGKYNYADALRELGSIVYTSIEFDELVSRIESSLCKILRSESVKLIFVKSDYLENQNSQSTFPKALSYMPTLRISIDLKGKELGSIFCGKKLSGDYYTKEDISLLETFSYQAATALSRAKLYLEVKEYAENLESKVIERTEDLRDAHENQRQMLIDISHNLQTPLTIFQTKIEEFKKKFPNDPLARNFETSLHKLSEFIYSLLKLAKLEQKDIQVEIGKINLSELIANITDEIKIIAKSHHISILGKLEPGMYINANEKEIRDAFMNILSNSIKYMRADGKKEIEMHLIKRDSRVVFTVKDTGIGIKESDSKHIFERFYRGNKSGDSMGTGIGLAITKKIIEKYGGKVWCESKENRGTTFFVEFPLLRED